MNESDDFEYEDYDIEIVDATLILPQGFRSLEEYREKLIWTPDT